MEILVKVLLKESRLRPKENGLKRSVIVSREKLMKAKIGRQRFIESKGKWLRYHIKETRSGPVQVVQVRGGVKKFARTASLKCIYFQAGWLDCTVGNMKAYFEEVHGVAKDRQRLVFAGKLLDDDERTFADIDMHKGCALHLVIQKA